MIVGEIRSRLWSVVEPVVEDEGLELVELEFIQERGRWILRVYMDTREGGVRVEDCERVSRRLSPVLDIEDLIPQRYVLEVSSPGIPRPLRQLRDFDRFTGRSARIEMIHPIGGRKRFRGEIAGVVAKDEPTVTIHLEEGGVVSLPVGQIKRARLVEEWD